MKPNFPQANFQNQPAYRQQAQEYSPQQQAPIYRAQSQPAYSPTMTNMTSIQNIKQQAQMQMRQQQPRRNQQEFCARHNETNVGFCPDQKQLVCNTCIFEKSLMNVKFTALVSKQLKGEFHQTFQDYKDKRAQVDQVDPNIVKQRAAIIVQRFFNNLSTEVKALQNQVNQKIKTSESLKELEHILESNRELFPTKNTSQVDAFEFEKKKFDEKITKGRFAYLVKRQEFYEQLIQSLETNSNRMKQTVEASSEQINKVLRYQKNDALVQNQLHLIVRENIDVDMHALDSSIAPIAMPTAPQQQFAPIASIAPKETIFSKVPLQQFQTVPRPNYSPVQQFSQVSPSKPMEPQSQHQSAPISPVNNPTRISELSCEEDSDVQIMQQPAIKFTEGLELEQPAFFKLKAMSLLKLIPNKGWAKVAPVNLYMAKCAQMPDQSVFIIGGSNDQKSQETVNTVTKFQIQQTGKVVMTEQAPMNQGRSSFGCTVNVHTNEIYVAGGYTQGVTTKKCEVYNVATNTWKELPQLNEEKCSSSLCILGGRYLYCIGGFSRADASGANLLNSIEMLDLVAPGAKWTMLSMKLPQSVCDMGSVAINKHSILLFGGWMKAASQQAFVLNQTIVSESLMTHSYSQVGKSLEKPDFFMVTGVGMREEQHKFKVCGHASLFTFNTQSMMFEGSSPI